MADRSGIAARGLPVAAVVCFTWALLVIGVALAQGAEASTGTQAAEGGLYEGRLVFDTSADQLGKPHRLTWYAEGRWWAVLRKSSGTGSGWRVWRRNSDGSWTFGPDLLSTTGADRFDVFRNPEDGRVFVHHLTTSQSRLLRLEFNAGLDMFTTAATTNVPTAYDGQAASLTVDTAGRVWIATHPNGRFAYTVRDGTTLGQLVPLTVLPDLVEPGSLVAGHFVDDHGPAVGFVYAGLGPINPGMFKVHHDADPLTTFTTTQFADQVDGHSTYAAAGRDVVVAWKDERDVPGEPSVLAMRRFPDGSWGPAVPVFNAKTTSSSGNHTRPRIVIDSENRRAHVAAAEITSSAVEVHERTASIDTLAFDPQRIIFRNGNPPTDGHVFRDVHAGQQPVTDESGLLWFARGREVNLGVFGSWSLWENVLTVGPGEPPAPVASVAISSAHEPVDEGGLVRVVAAVVGSASVEASVAWGDGAVVSVPVVDGVVAAEHTYRDDGVFTIVVGVADGTGGVVSDEVVQRVDNVAPVITSDSGAVAVEVGEEFVFDVTFADPGVDDRHTVVVDFGDGVEVVEELTGGQRAVSVVHAYQAAGEFGIQVTVTDDGGGAATLSRTAAVTAVDPGDPPPEEPPPSDITFVGGSTASVHSGTELSVAAPVDVAVGDVLVASLTVRGKPSIRKPDGWSLVRVDSSGKAVTKATYMRVVGAGDATAGLWRFSASSAATGEVVAYRGVDVDRPVDADGGATSGPRSTTVTAPSVTTTADGARLVGFFGVATSTTITAPGDMVGRTHVASSGGVTGGAADVLQEVAGLSASYTAVVASGERGVGHLIALRPALP